MSTSSARYPATKSGAAKGSAEVMWTWPRDAGIMRYCPSIAYLSLGGRRAWSPRKVETRPLRGGERSAEVSRAAEDYSPEHDGLVRSVLEDGIPDLGAEPYRHESAKANSRSRALNSLLAHGVELLLSGSHPHASVDHVGGDESRALLVPLGSSLAVHV